MEACVVGQCGNKLEYERDPATGSLRPVRKFYSFPTGTDENSKKQLEGWTDFVTKSKGIASKTVGTCRSVICSAHFIGEVKSDDPRRPNFLPTIFPTPCDEAQVQYGLLDLVSWWDQKGWSFFPTFNPVVMTKEPTKARKSGPQSKTQAAPQLKTFVLIENDVESCVPSVLRSITIHEDLSFEAYVKGTLIPANEMFPDEHTSECKFNDVQEFASGLHTFKSVNVCQGVSCGVEVQDVSRYNGKVVVHHTAQGKPVPRVVSNDCEKFINAKVCIACKKIWSSITSALHRGAAYKHKMDGVEETEEGKIARLEKSIDIYKMEAAKLENTNKSLKNRIGVLRTALVQEQNCRETPLKQLGRIPVKREGQEQHNQGEQRIRIVHPSKIMENEQEPSSTAGSVPVRKVIRITAEQAAKLGKIIPAGGGNVIRVPISQLASVKQVINLDQ